MNHFRSMLRSTSLLEWASRAVVVAMLAVPLLAVAGALPGPAGGFGGGTVAGVTSFTGQVTTTGGLVTQTTTTDFQVGAQNSTANTCATYNAGDICWLDSMSVNAASASARLTLNTTASSNQGYAQLQFQTAGTNAGRLMYNGASGAQLDADLAGTIALVGYGGYVATVGQDATSAAGTVIFKVMDALGGTAQTVLTVDGEGNLFLLANATRSKGDITLAAGTGTATVASGAKCTCTDTTAANAVRCAVSGTTLTATGTGTDVITYHCF